MLTLRNLVLTTVVTVLVSSGVTAAVQYLSTRATSGVGVDISVISDPDKVGAFGPPIDVVLPVGASTRGSPGKGCDGFHDWALARGAADANKTRLQVIVRGTDPGEVVVNGMRVVIDKRKAPLKGIHLLCPSAGDLAERRILIDLDRARPEALYKSADGRRFGFTVTKGEVESFLVTAKTRSHLVRWHLLLDLVVGDSHRTVRVGPANETFSTTATSHGAVWEWDFSSKWVTSGQEPVPAGSPLPRPGAQRDE